MEIGISAAEINQEPGTKQLARWPSTHTCIFWVAWDPTGLGPGPDQWHRVAVAMADNSCSHGDKEWRGIEAAPASGVGSLDLLSPEPILQCLHKYSLA